MTGKRFAGALRYHLWRSGRSLGLYYLLIVLAGIVLGVLNRNSQTGWSGLEAATGIYLLVQGFSAFHERLPLFLQHGFSRGTLVLSFCLGGLLLCLGLAAADSLLWLLHSQWTPVRSFFQQVYAAGDYQLGAKTFFLTLVWNFSLDLMAYLLGFFVGGAYYRMRRATRLAVSIGVPVLVALGLPALDGLTGGAAGAALNGFFRWALYGPGMACPWCGMRSFLLAAVLLAALSFLLARRAELRRET